VALIDSNDYDWIRDRIGPSQTTASLPASKIERYLDEAEEFVTSRVDVTSLSESDLVHAKRAALYYCASLIAPTADIPTSESVAGVGSSYSRQTMKPAENEERLRRRADEELGYLTTETPFEEDDLKLLELAW
jgi:hypothetical protein